MTQENMNDFGRHSFVTWTTGLIERIEMSKHPKSVKEQISELLGNELWCFFTTHQIEELAESLTRLFRRILRRKKNASKNPRKIT